MKYLILFDIDGTILNLKTYYSREIFSNVLRDFFLSDIIIDNTFSFRGKTDLEILRLVTGRYNLDFSLILNNLNLIWDKLLLNFKKFYKSENFQLVNGIDVFLEILAKNEDLLLGLQTGNFQKNAFEKLKVFGFDKYFNFGAFGSDFEDRSKLIPLAINRANEFIGNEIFNNKNTLIIGDSDADIVSAKSNNLPIIVVNSNENLIDRNLLDYADLIIENYNNPNFLIEKIYSIFEKNEKN